ncbi:MAG: response regulator [Bdellovibrionales bacterium]|nr:response regulator [Bdellovibrionales bacterium]
MAKAIIVLIEDERDIRELISFNLSKEQYQIQSAASGEEGLDLITSARPDLVVLDLMLPGIDGLEVCRRIRSNPTTASLPIIMLTARGEEADIVSGLELGADDYLTKPFSPRVLLARVKAALRRSKSADVNTDQILNVHELMINPAKHEVFVGNSPLELTSTEFKILSHLACKPGYVFTRYQIVKAVHGDDYPVTDRSIDVQIAGLRKKLGTAGDYIETVRGVGYRFRE